MTASRRLARASLIALASVAAGGCVSYLPQAEPPAHPVDAPDPAPGVHPVLVPSDPWRSGTERLTLYARGVQIWRCELAAGKPVWKFVGPRAELFDASGAKVGCHIKGADGPAWLLGSAGGITGRKADERASPNPGAVPELRLSVVAARGSFEGVVAILRLETVGGVAPSDGAACWDGQEVEVPYTATYVFLGTDR